MPNKTTNEVVGQFAPMSITTTLQGMKADIPKIVAAGNVAEVNRLRTKIVNLRKLESEVTKAFDDAVTAAQGGFNGEDFLAGVTTIIKRDGRGRKAAAAPEVDPSDFF